ncbi:phage GP46 family protein [Vibrio scophthalmi]|uniref:Phage protein n=1 Tax=Vibrio scophthalmi TaxID=45658 RepID=A0A1E3WJ01_9VIBR|nr:phage GP46 family protein [Vibrio scophthalmi]ODS09759.1 hypothetical protein VSF3289_03221 [Vibrio scophthalmi]
MSHFNLQALSAPISSREGMTHAVWQSIYNHAQATKNDQKRMGEMTRGGCWSESFLTLVASRGWTISREKLAPQILRMAKRFYEEALSWLVDEEHAKSVVVDVWEEDPNTMCWVATITLTNGDKFEVKP